MSTCIYFLLFQVRGSRIVSRHPQARVWAIFSALADPADFDAPRYLDYVQVSSESVDR